MKLVFRVVMLRVCICVTDAGDATTGLETELVGSSDTGALTLAELPVCVTRKVETENVGWGAKVLASEWAMINVRIVDNTDLWTHWDLTQLARTSDTMPKVATQQVSTIHTIETCVRTVG